MRYFIFTLKESNKIRGGKSVERGEKRDPSSLRYAATGERGARRGVKREE